MHGTCAPISVVSGYANPIRSALQPQRVAPLFGRQDSHLLTIAWVSRPAMNPEFIAGSAFSGLFTIKNSLNSRLNKRYTLSKACSTCTSVSACGKPQPAKAPSITATTSRPDRAWAPAHAQGGQQPAFTLHHTQHSGHQQRKRDYHGHCQEQICAKYQPQQRARPPVTAASSDACGLVGRLTACRWSRSPLRHARWRRQNHPPD